MGDFVPYTGEVITPKAPDGFEPYSGEVVTSPVVTTPTTPVEKRPHVTGATFAPTLAENIIPSAGHAVEDLAQAVLHPVDTAEGMARIATGAVQKGLNKLGVDTKVSDETKRIMEERYHYLSALDPNKPVFVEGMGMVIPKTVLPMLKQYISGDADKERDTNRLYADAMLDFYKERFGGGQNIADTMAYDPFGFVMDLSTLLTGAGGLLRQGSRGVIKPGPSIARKVRDTGYALTKAGNYTDPLQLAVRAATKGVEALPELPPVVFGTTSGVGGDVVKTAFETAREAEKLKGQTTPAAQRANEAMLSLEQAINKELSPSETVAKAREGISAMKEAASDAYIESRNGPRGWGKDTTQLDFTPINKAWDDLYASLFSNGNKDLPKVDAGELAKIEKIGETIKKWEANPDNHTLAGLDDLKQAIQNVTRSAEETQVDRVATGLAKTVKKITNEQATALYGQADNPYSRSLAAYEKHMNELKEMERSLSLKKGTSIDTVARKLLSVMRDNVNTNFGERQRLVKALEDRGNVSLMPEIAGHSLHAWHPRGIQGALAGATPTAAAVAAGATLNPMAFLGLLGMPAASPRVVGGAAINAGKAAGMYDRTAGPYFTPLAESAANYFKARQHPLTLDAWNYGRMAEETEERMKDKRARGGYLSRRSRRARGGAIRRYADGGVVQPQQAQQPQTADFFQKYALPGAFSDMSKDDEREAQARRGRPVQPLPSAPLMDDSELAPRENLFGQMIDLAKKFAKKPDPKVDDKIAKAKRDAAAAAAAAGQAPPLDDSDYDEAVPIPAAAAATSQTPVTKRPLSPMEAPDTGTEYAPETMPYLAGIPANYFSLLRNAESGTDDSAVNPGTKASGRFQFLPSTWAYLAKQYPDLKLTPQNILDPTKQARAVEKYTEQSRDRLRALFERDPTAAELYMMHWFGHAGGESLLKNPDKKLGDLLPNIVFRKNPNLRRNMTTKQLLAALGRKWE